MVRDVGTLCGVPGHANICVLARSTLQRVQRVLKRIDEPCLVTLREGRQGVTGCRRA